MNTSIRTKFSIGIVFFFIIILVLSTFSAFYLNRLSKKTSAILKENHISVMYARDMSASLMIINQEITTSFLTNKITDSSLINKELHIFDSWLQLEKMNITEPGEDKLVASIETDFIQYHAAVARYKGSLESVTELLSLQKEFGKIYQQLAHLSQLNENAIELKTDDAKLSAKNALTQMTILGSLCFLIALSFTYSFASYFNERFYQLYNGIKEIVSSNFGQRLHFDGKDEFYEISLVFNEMASKLNADIPKSSLSQSVEIDTYMNSIDDVRELKELLVRIKSMEEQATILISKLDKMK